MTAALAALAADGLGKRYGRRWALSDCTLQVPPGRAVGLVGPNGAGKLSLEDVVLAYMSRARHGAGLGRRGLSVLR